MAVKTQIMVRHIIIMPVLWIEITKSAEECGRHDNGPSRRCWRCWKIDEVESISFFFDGRGLSLCFRAQLCTMVNVAAGIDKGHQGDMFM